MAASLAATAVLASSVGVATVAAADTSGSVADPVVTATVTSDASQANVTPGSTLHGLVEGSNVHVHAQVPSGAVAPGNTIFTLSLRLCKSGVSISGASQFDPTAFGNCIAAPFVSGPPQLDDDFTTVDTNAPNNVADLDFRVGTGTQTFSTSQSGNQTITCNATNPCALWADISVDTANTANGSGHLWKHFNVTYAGQPDPPTGVTANPVGSTTATISWAAPAFTGNATITSYIVTLTGGPSTPASPVTVSGSTLSQAFTGLTTFTSYSATVQARNTAADGSTTNTSSPSAPPTTFQPAPGAPSNVSGVPGDSQVDLTWTAPTGPTPNQYEVTVSPGPVSGANPRLTGSSTTSYTFTDLSNGTPYTFTVRAVYGTTAPFSFSAPSPASAPVAPAGALITQTITVTRPQGALILTQVCGALGNTHTGTAPTLSDGVTPDPNFDTVAGEYPYPPNFTPNYPTNCNVDLGTATLIASGPGANQYFSATGNINQVTVTDFRDTDPGWTVTGRMGNFVSGANSFSGNQLGWTPAATDAAPFTDGSGNTYDQVAVAGTAVPANTNPGLGAGSELAHADAGSGQGRARLDAALTLWIPVTAKAGSYTGILTITAV